jgi:hypothetical protein
MRAFILILAVAMLTLPWGSRRDAQGQTGPSHFQAPHDTIPNFAQNPRIQSVRNGNWSNPATWNLSRVPNSSDIVVVRHTVTYDTPTGIADVIGIDTQASLRFRTDISTRLQVGTLLVMPNGTLEVGTPSSPVHGNVTAEIIIRNRPLNLALDPDQYGTGILAIDGTVTMHGAVKSPTFVRTAVEPRAGHTTLQLEQPVSGWKAGDRIFVPDTRQVGVDNWFNSNYALQVEERTIQSIAADGRTLTLAAGLSFDHRGARDADGTPTVHNGIKLLPHVGNLTRNIIIRSENPTGTRGHTLFTHRTDVNIRYVQFQNLGRTRATTLNSVSNHIGRYPLHIHHLWGPVNPANTGYQFQLVGNAVNDSLKWPIAIHDSHYGLIQQNVVFGGSQLTGAGIAVEDGSETENLFEKNFVANIRGNVNPRESGSDTLTPGAGAECYWAAGFNNRFVNNVASDCRNPFQQIVSGPGWKFFVPSGRFNTRNPLFRGADMTNTSQTVSVTPQLQPLREFRGNEVYGGSAAGLTAWHLGTSGYDIPTGIKESVVKDFRVWHVYEAAIWNYPVHKFTVDGLVYRIDPAATVYWEAAIQSGDYRDIDLTIRGGSIHAGSVFGGTEAPLGTYRIENVRAVTRNHAFSFVTPETPGTGAGIPDPPGITVIMRNTVITPWPGQPLRTIGMDFQSTGASYPNVRYDVLVYDYQGQAGNNVQVYWHEQATQNIAGGRAPCTATRPEIDGLVCPIAGSPGVTPLAAPTNLHIAN